jgi:hypothetical protein
VNVYLDSGVFIDYLSARGFASSLRRSDRRGRRVEQLAHDAESLLHRLSSSHRTATSCLTLYEVEEALFRELADGTKGVTNTQALLIPAARSIAVQTLGVIEYFGVEMLDLTRPLVERQLQSLPFQTRGIRSADALHLSTAVAFAADIFVTTDGQVSGLDGLLRVGDTHSMRCLDTDGALAMIPL